MARGSRDGIRRSSGGRSVAGPGMRSGADRTRRSTARGETSSPRLRRSGEWVCLQDRIVDPEAGTGIDCGCISRRSPTR